MLSQAAMKVNAILRLKFERIMFRCYITVLIECIIISVLNAIKTIFSYSIKNILSSDSSV